MLASLGVSALADDPQPTYYTVSVSPSTGGNAVASHMACEAGTFVSLSAAPAVGYKFSHWTISGAVVADPTNPSVTFHMPANNVIVSANFIPVYTITVQSLGGGQVEVSAQTAQPGQVITLMASPLPGYSFYYWSSSPTVSFLNAQNYLTTFVMPASNVIIGANFVADAPAAPTQPSTPAQPTTPSAPTTPTVPENNGPFKDVRESDWFNDDVLYVYENGFMNGVGEKTFAPKTGANRAMIVTILHRMLDTPAAQPSEFTDVDANAYYANAVAWASENGIVGGYGNGIFAPNDAITREQLAAILFRFAEARGYDVSIGEDTNILSYDDFSDVSEYAIPAFQWACGSGIINGNGSKLSPKASATRAEIAAILHRFCDLFRGSYEG